MKINFPKLRTDQYIYLFVVLLSSLFVLIKAANASITHDEAFTFSRFIKAPIIDTLLWKDMYLNNHYLNSILASISIRIFKNSSELIIRLPNVISFLIYLFASYKLVLKVNKGYFRIITFILLICNLYLLEMFTLARGYGLSIAFMMASLVCAIYSLEGQSTKRNTLKLISIIFGGLSVLSSLTMLLYFISLNAVFVIEASGEFIKNFKRSKNEAILKITNTLLPLLTISFLLLAYVAEVIVYGRENKQFYVGGLSLIEDTFTSIFKASYYIFSDSFDNQLTIIGYLFTIIVITLTLIVFIFRKSFKKHHFFLVGIIAIYLLGNITLHHATGTLYFVERMGMFLYPLFLIAFLPIIDQILSSLKDHNKVANTILKFILLSLFIVHLFLTFSKLSIEKSYGWSYNYKTKPIMQKIIHKEPDLLCVHWRLSPSVNYYRSQSSKQIAWKVFDSEKNSFNLQEILDECTIIYSTSPIKVDNRFTTKEIEYADSFVYEKISE